MEEFVDETAADCEAYSTAWMTLVSTRILIGEKLIAKLENVPVCTCNHHIEAIVRLWCFLNWRCHCGNCLD